MSNVMSNVIYCPFCCKSDKISYEERTDTYKIHGRDITVTLPMPVCARCQKDFSTTSVDEKSVEMVKAKYQEEVAAENAHQS